MNDLLHPWQRKTVISVTLSRYLGKPTLVISSFGVRMHDLREERREKRKEGVS